MFMKLLGPTNLGLPRFRHPSGNFGSSLSGPDRKTACLTVLHQLAQRTFPDRADGKEKRLHALAAQGNK